jgi:Ca-activated chloride channel family protein
MPRRRAVIVILVLILIAVLVFVLARCKQMPAVAGTVPTPATAQAGRPSSSPEPGPNAAKAAPKPEEKLTPATLVAPAEIGAGSVFKVEWTGPDNEGDYVTIVDPGSVAAAYGNYVETRKGRTLELAAPVAPGNYELRYVTSTSKTVLGRTPLRVLEAVATLDAPPQVTAGTPFHVAWSGPNNPGDYVTIVTKGAPDGRYESYAETAKGSPLELVALITPGEAELRYMTGSGARVVARRPITVAPAAIALDAPAEAVIGSIVPIVWTGPNNRGDYVTIVPKATKDGLYARYADTTGGSPAKVEAPIDPGPAEIRYMSGQGAKVLARREISVVPAKVTLKAPPLAAAESTVSIEWTGPNNPGDYLTIVPKTAKDGASLHTYPAARNSPAAIRMPKDVGPAEIRYMSGQGNRVLGRAEIRCTSGG